MSEELTDNGSNLHSLPTVAVAKPPTLPVLLASQVETDKHLATIERVLWYLLVLVAVQELLLVALVGGMCYLIGQIR